MKNPITLAQALQKLEAVVVEHYKAGKCTDMESNAMLEAIMVAESTLEDNPDDDFDEPVDDNCEYNENGSYTEEQKRIFQCDIDAAYGDSQRK